MTALGNIFAFARDRDAVIQHKVTKRFARSVTATVSTIII
jgi:hypothetical protein